MRLGKGKKAPILVCLTKLSDKGEIFKRGTNLKDLTYSVDEQLLSRTREKKIHLRKTAAENKTRTVDKLITSFEKGKLMVNNQEFAGQHKTPPLKEILTPTTVQLADRMKIEVTRGQDIQVEGSTFTGCSASVATLKDVNDMYAKVRQWNGDARHVICAFRIPHPDHHIYQNYNDNDEHGGGRILLSAMKQSEMSNRMLLVVRKYEGVHIGHKRFDAILRSIHSTQYVTKINTFGLVKTPSQKQNKVNCQGAEEEAEEEEVIYIPWYNGTMQSPSSSQQQEPGDLGRCGARRRGPLQLKLNIWDLHS